MSEIAVDGPHCRSGDHGRLKKMGMSRCERLLDFSGIDVGHAEFDATA
jgi:hypothetical protein